MKLLSALLLFSLLTTPTPAQESLPEAADTSASPATDTAATAAQTSTDENGAPVTGDPATDDSSTARESTSLEDVGSQAKELAAQTSEKVGELADTLDKTEAAQDVSAGVLNPIYRLADSLAFPGFYWVAFMLMVTGSVSYALQLVLGKLVVLSRGSMNIREILSDTVALAISLIGLVLTTQAATQNSTFSATPSAVLSATAVGAVLGVCLYRWGQAEEVDAAMGRKAARSTNSKKS